MKLSAKVCGVPAPKGARIAITAPVSFVGIPTSRQQKRVVAVARGKLLPPFPREFVWAEIPSTRRLVVVINSGAVMLSLGDAEGGALPAPAIIDFDSLSYSHFVPMRFEHDPEKPIGHSVRVVQKSEGLVAYANLSLQTPMGRRVLAEADRGFVWEASIGCQATMIDFVPNKESVRVNGRLFVGPVYVYRGARMDEFSVVDYGADRKTAVRVLAAGPGGNALAATIVAGEKARQAAAAKSGQARLARAV